MRTLSLFLFFAFISAGCPANRTGERQGPVKEPSPPSTPRMISPPFDGTRAFDFLLAQTSTGPRNVNSPGHQACLTYLQSTLTTLADRVRLQQFDQVGYHGELLHLSNVIATFDPGAASRILLCAHWDTRPRADRDPDRKKRDTPILGANDGASGVAVLLEIAEILKTTPPPVGVDIVLFDGEDYGREGDNDMYLLGSRYFASKKQPDYIPRFGILLDMIGDKDLEIPKEQSSVRYAPDVVQLIWDTARELGVEQFVDEQGEEIMDDHWPLNNAGIKTVDLIDFNYPDQTNRYWHTTQDTPDHCSAQSLQAVGSVLLHVIYSQYP